MREIVDSHTDVQRGGQQNAPADAPDRSRQAPRQDPDPSPFRDNKAEAPTESGPDLHPSTKRSGHDRRGRFAKGNTESLKHGRWSAAAAHALLPEQIETLAMLADREAAVLVDLGGGDELSTFERDLVTRYQQLDAVAAFNAPRMLSGRAAVRNQARDTFMACVDRQLKIIGLLGLRRRQKHIGELSLQDFLATQDHDDQDRHATEAER